MLPMSDTQSHLIRALFMRNKRGLLSYFRRRVGREDAADLLQETYVRTLRHGQFEAATNPAAFLQQIALNLNRDFARRRKTEVTYLRFGHFLADPPSDEAPPEERIDYDRKSRLLNVAIDALPPRCREVFDLALKTLRLARLPDGWIFPIEWCESTSVSPCGSAGRRWTEFR
jgi:RNA polymerase sigma factor (sigma-70 family)